MRAEGARVLSCVGMTGPCIRVCTLVSLSCPPQNSFSFSFYLFHFLPFSFSQSSFLLLFVLSNKARNLPNKQKSEREEEKDPPISARKHFFLPSHLTQAPVYYPIKKKNCTGECSHRQRREIFAFLGAFRSFLLSSVSLAAAGDGVGFLFHFESRHACCSGLDRSIFSPFFCLEI